jgi:ketosteroid isomerase-like protein
MSNEQTSQKERNKQLVGAWYAALAAVDVEGFLAVQTDDVAYNVTGRTPVSGFFQGKKTLTEDILPLVFNALQTETFQFSKRWKIMCADESRVTAIMEAEGLASNGLRYDQRYCHIFGFRDDKISEVWEFFDTALAAVALFGNELVKPEPDPKVPFRF